MDRGQVMRAKIYRGKNRQDSDIPFRICVKCLLLLLVRFACTITNS